MSWSINVTGYRSAVKAAVLADQNIPLSLKSAITDICDAPPENLGGRNGIRVSAFGNVGRGFNFIGKCEVEPVQILEPILNMAPEPAPMAGQLHSPPLRTPPVSNDFVADGCANFTGAEN